MSNKMSIEDLEELRMYKSQRYRLKINIFGSELCIDNLEYKVIKYFCKWYESGNSLTFITNNVTISRKAIGLFQITYSERIDQEQPKISLILRDLP